MKPTYEELERQLEESRREFRAADATIHNLELKLTDQAVQLANAESKYRELAAAENNLIDSECHVSELEACVSNLQVNRPVIYGDGFYDGYWKARSEQDMSNEDENHG